jgi:hypothetical protein
VPDNLGMISRRLDSSVSEGNLDAVERVLANSRAGGMDQIGQAITPRASSLTGLDQRTWLRDILMRRG